MFATRRGTLYKLIQRLWQRCRPFLRHDSIFLPSFLGGFLFLTLSLSLSFVNTQLDSMRIRIALFGNEHVRYYEKDISYYQRFVTFRGRPATPIKRRFFVPFKKNKMHQVYLWTQAFFNCEDRLIRRQQQKEKEKRDNYRSESLHQSFEMNATRQWIGHQS